MIAILGYKLKDFCGSVTYSILVSHPKPVFDWVFNFVVYVMNKIHVDNQNFTRLEPSIGSYLPKELGYLRTKILFVNIVWKIKTVEKNV